MVRVVLFATLLLFVPSVVATPTAHYVPHAGDSFSYDETYVVGNGTGTYEGYSETTTINGSVRVTAVVPNGTESASYYNLDVYQNSTGARYHWISSGEFSFSAATFHYVVGTDNQTDYTNPLVWFYMNNSLPPGQSFYLLNSQMFVVSTDDNYHLATAAGSYVRAIFAEGNGSYQRNDVYGVFSATYNWKAYFDPATGYIVGYLYTEQDSNGAGTGFTITDTLGVTSTTYPLTAGTAPSTSSGSSGPSSLLLVLGIVLIVVVVIAVIAWALRSRSRRRLPTHSAHGEVRFPTPAGPSAPPLGPAPPPISLTPSGQPTVQQIIIKETVKVKCQYCGALIDSTAERCPFCGAART